MRAVIQCESERGCWVRLQPFPWFDSSFSCPGDIPVNSKELFPQKWRRGTCPAATSAHCMHRSIVKSWCREMHMHILQSSKSFFEAKDAAAKMQGGDFSAELLFGHDGVVPRERWATTYGQACNNIKYGHLDPPPCLCLLFLFFDMRSRRGGCAAHQSLLTRSPGTMLR